MLSSNTSAVSGDTTYIEDVFSTYLYTGTGSALTITNGLDLSTKGGLAWVKSRGTAVGHVLTDVPGYFLRSNTTDAQTADSTKISAFTTTGFSLGTDASVNNNGTTYASWTFRKQAKFFDVVTYTGNGTSQNIAHSLGSTPGTIIVKKVSNIDPWGVWHRSFAANEYILLNTTAAKQSSNFIWNNTAPTSTQFSVGASGTTNDSGLTYVAYLFAHDAGGFGLTGTDNVISCGSYTGNGSATGPTVTLGYEPQYLMVKRTDSTSGADWYIFDNMRGMSFSSANVLRANDSSAESTTAAGAGIIPTATGFQPITTAAGINASGGTYIYIAIRRGPMKVPTDGTTVFSPVATTTTTTSTSVSTGFPVDMMFRGLRATSSGKFFNTRLTGANKSLDSTTTDAEAAVLNIAFDNQTGISDVGTLSGYTAVYEAFRRAPSFFDEVCYTGTGSAQTQTHNLGAAPEMMIVKCRSATGSWPVYSSALGANKYVILNGVSTPSTNTTTWNNTAPTSTVFSVGSSDQFINASSQTYVAYLFATCAGVSKVGSYTGTGATQTIDCGFAGGARFVLIKRTDSTGDWYVWDTARGIVSGNDPYLLLNSTAAEVTSTDYIDTYSAGFELSSTAPAALNASGGTYIFLAIA